MDPATKRVVQVRLATAEEFTPPKSGRVWVVSGVPSRPNLGWGERITSGCLQTTKNSDIFRVGELWTPTVATATEKKDNPSMTVVLLDFSRSWDNFGALLWALLPTHSVRLSVAAPGDAWDLAAHVPDLHRLVGQSWVCAVSLEPKTWVGKPHVCNVGFGDDGREARLDRFDFAWNHYYLPVFLCEE